MRKIAVPRPLKRSIPIAQQLELDYPDSDDCLRDIDAERELQQIFNTNGFSTPVPASEMHGLSAFEDHPFFNSMQDEGVEFPRLGLSPMPFKDSGVVPSRARNPITLNTPFGLQKEIVNQSVLPLSNQLELLSFSDHDSPATRRARSYSEPLPFVYATGDSASEL
jgi:hypothetical protein